MTSTKNKETKASQRNAELRARGLRPVVLWVPDTRRPEFVEECRRQAKILANAPEEKEILEQLTHIVQSFEDWTM